MTEAIIIIASLTALVILWKKTGVSRSAPVYESPESPILTTSQSPTLEDLYRQHGMENGLDPMLLKAIAQVESSENPLAKNPADPSYGLMQILCQDDGAGSCRNTLNVLDWPPQSRDQLYDPDYSLHIGAQILSWNISRYGMKKGIAVYNSWSAHNDPQDGPFVNQSYVDKVLRAYNALKPQTMIAV